MTVILITIVESTIIICIAKRSKNIELTILSVNRRLIRGIAIIPGKYFYREHRLDDYFKRRGQSAAQYCSNSNHTFNLAKAQKLQKNQSTLRTHNVYTKVQSTYVKLDVTLVQQFRSSTFWSIVEKFVMLGKLRLLSFLCCILIQTSAVPLLLFR